MKKKLLALALVCLMVLALVPTAALAAEDGAATATVYVTVSRNGAVIAGKDGTPVAQVPVTLTGKDAYTLDDVFAAVHTLCYEGTDGYASTSGDYGLSVTKFWGEDGANVGYQMNGGAVSVMGPGQAVSHGDYVDAYLTQSYYPDTEAYARFDTYTAQAAVGEPVALTLSEAGYDENWNMVFTPCAGAALTVNGGAVEPAVVTDSDGKAQLTFDAAGTYVVSATKSKTVADQTVTAITAPVCVVTVAAGGPELVLHRIAEKYTRSGIVGDPNAPWLAADLAAYAKAYPETANVLSAQQVQAYLDVLIPAAAEAEKPGDLAKSILALRALGYDARTVTTADGETVDVAAKLAALVDSHDSSVTNSYTLPYVLLALEQGEGYATQAQIDYLLEQAVAGQESWQSTQWGTDGVTPMLLALAPHRDNAQVKAAVEVGLQVVKDYQKEDGGMGNAASTGLAMAAYAVLGQDPAEVRNDAGKSLVDGLMGEATEGLDGFQPTTNTFSTEQGFRGLAAWALYQKTGAAVGVYDFADSPLTPAAATPTPEKVFDDVPAGHWAAGAISAMTKRGLFQGTTETAFAPNQPMDRAMLATLLYRLAEGSAWGENPFDDVPGGSWYTDAVVWAAANKLVEGTGTGFEPTRAITREEMVTLLRRYAQYTGSDAGAKADLSGYTDADQVSSWAQDAMSWAVAEGLVKGRTATELAPKGTATRAEGAAIFQNFLALIEG